jgi:hypothetical protein
MLECPKCGAGVELGAKDCGPELPSQAFVDWCQEHEVEIRYVSFPVQETIQE